MSHRDPKGTRVGTPSPSQTPAFWQFTFSPVFAQHCTTDACVKPRWWCKLEVYSEQCLVWYSDTHCLYTLFFNSNLIESFFSRTNISVSVSMECFLMTSRRSYWCPKTMKWRPYWCPKPVLWELNSFLMQTLSFVPINLHICSPSEWKHSIARNDNLEEKQTYFYSVLNWYT